MGILNLGDSDTCHRRDSDYRASDWSNPYHQLYHFLRHEVQGAYLELRLFCNCTRSMLYWQDMADYRTWPLTTCCDRVWRLLWYQGPKKKKARTYARYSSLPLFSYNYGRRGHVLDGLIYLLLDLQVPKSCPNYKNDSGSWTVPKYVLMHSLDWLCDRFTYIYWWHPTTRKIVLLDAWNEHWGQMLLLNPPELTSGHVLTVLKKREIKSNK